MIVAKMNDAVIATKPTGTIFQPIFLSRPISLPKDKPAQVSTTVVIDRNGTALRVWTKKSATGEIGLHRAATMVVSQISEGILFLVHLAR